MSFSTIAIGNHKTEKSGKQTNMMDRVRLFCMAALLCMGALVYGADEAFVFATTADGSVTVTRGDVSLRLRPIASRSDWWRAFPVPAGKLEPLTPAFRYESFGLEASGAAQFSPAIKEGVTNGVQATWTFTVRNGPFETALECVVPAKYGRRFKWRAGQETGTSRKLLPSGLHRDLRLYIDGVPIVNAWFRNDVSMRMYDRGGGEIHIRIGSGVGAAGEKREIGCGLYAAGAASFRAVAPLRMEAGSRWRPLGNVFETEAGSILDFSGFRPTGTRCGEKGRVIVNEAGHFAFESEPAKPIRFYGMNLCFDALYMEHEETDRMLDRFCRLGYNAIRIHHYEPNLVEPYQSTGYNWNKTAVDRFYYLVAACSKRGIYLTSDLYVFRKASWKQIGRTAEGEISFGEYKALVPGDEGAYRDFMKWTKEVFGSVNPYTGKRVCDDPAWICLSLVNEPDYTSDVIRNSAGWKQKWNEWLAKKYPTAEALKEAFGAVGKDEDPKKGTIEIPAGFARQGFPRSLQAREFVSDQLAAFVARARRDLAHELGWKIPVADMNSTYQENRFLHSVRADMDYVDIHFYIDHPVGFGASSFNYPSETAHRNPMSTEGVEDWTHVAGTRVFGKPFVVSEFNYCSPNRWRASGVSLIGALAGYQDWDAMWRFSWANNAENVVKENPMKFFFVAQDPLALLADRAVVAFFLRGDLAVAGEERALVTDVGTLRGRNGRNPGLAALHRGAFGARVGTRFGDRTLPFEEPSAYAGVVATPEQSIVIDTDRCTCAIDSPRTALLHLRGGTEAAVGSGVLRVEADEEATIAAISADGKPLGSSRRILVTHLTDLQNTGMTYLDETRRTAFVQGTTPYLVKDGSAKVSLALEDAERFEVYAVDLAGRRIGKIASTVKAGRLAFCMQTGSQISAEPVLAYEIAEKSPAE